MRSSVLSLCLLSLVLLVGGELDYCRPDKCKLPNCYCGGKKIPGTAII